MKKYMLVSLIAATVLACNVRRNDKVVDDAVKQSVEAMKDTTSVQLIDSLYNFGTVSEGETVTYNFRFKNVGKKPMVIMSANASCGCTIPEKPEKPIMAGETGVIKVVFNSKGRSGHQEKHINVTANTNPSFPVLVLTGDVTAAK